MDAIEKYSSIIEQTSTQVQILIENGVDKVTTSMGYKFSDDGLHIQRSGSEMENRLDETGMYVMRGNEIMLQANKDGVIGTDMTVRNYLIIGSHARFEDYTDDDGAAEIPGRISKEGEPSSSSDGALKATEVTG